MSSQKATRLGRDVYVPPNARGGRGKPTCQQDMPQVAARTSDTNTSSTVPIANIRVRDKGNVKGTVESRQCVQAKRGAVDMGRDIGEGLHLGTSSDGNANDAINTELVAGQSALAVETAAAPTDLDCTRSPNVVYIDGRNKSGKDPPPAPICDINTNCSRRTDTERSGGAVNTAGSNDGDASREVVATESSIDRGGSTRRKPRKAWSQYVPPTRRGGGNNAGATTIVANLSCATTMRAPVTSVMNYQSPTRLGDVAGTAEKPTKRSPEEVSQRISSSELHAAAKKIIQVPNPEYERERETHGGITPEPRSNHGSTDEIAVKLKALSVTSASIGQHSHTEGETTVNAIETGDMEAIAYAAVDGDLTAAGVQCERSGGPISDKAAAVSPAAAAEAAETKADVGIGGASAEEKRGEIPAQEENTRISAKIAAVKTVSTPYVPPGGRMKVESAPQNDGESMGPLWPSGLNRKPVRVSQKARASDGGSSPSRSSPFRVATAVSGGKSAYGVSIEEYSGEQDLRRVTVTHNLLGRCLPPEWSYL